MRGLAPLATTLVLLASAQVRAQVSQCTQKMSPIPGEALQRSIDLLKAKFPALTFPTEEPCGHAKATVQALTRTLRRNYLKSLVGYDLVKIVSGESYFTVERFKVGNPKDLRGLASALKGCNFCGLEIEASTCLDHFVTADSVVLMTSSAVGCSDNVEKFKLIRKSLLSLEREKQ